MTTLQAIILLSGISVLFLGFYGWYGNRRKPLNISFALMSLFFALWILTNLLFEFTHSGLFFKTTYVVGLFIPSFILLWLNYLVKNSLSLRFKAMLIGQVLFSIIFSGILYLTDLITNITSTETTFQIHTGPLFLALVVYMLILFGTLIGHIFYLYRVALGKSKLQLRFVLLGIFVTTAFIFLVSFILPSFGYLDLSPLDSPSLIIFVSFAAYAIIKHRLMDIRTVVARSVAFSLIIGILAAFYAGAVFVANSLIFTGESQSTAYIAYQAFLGLVMALTFQPLRRWVTKATDKIFFKNQYNAEELLDTLAHTIGETIVLITLTYKTLDLLVSQMKVTRGIFVILTDSGSIFTSQSSGYKASPKLVAKDITSLAKDGILIYDELEETSRYKHILRKYDAAGSIPLKTENTTEGVLLLGEKQSGDMFSATDLKVFEIIAPELAVAITNAKAFEKIERFNVTLRQEIKKATTELEKRNEQLRELDKAKDEFISMASHQLRTPLTAIKGYLSMLLEGDAGEIKVSQYDFVNEAFSGANRMVGLINDLLNVSRMETGRFFLEPVEIDAEKMMAEEVKQLENHAKEKKLYLKSEVKGKMPKIWGDETKIRQVMMNFIDNALYYTTQGGVKVELSADKKDVTFKVVDTGIGVPKAQQKNLFTKFYRADNARHVRPDGTGLGIYLAKRVIDDHGGELIFHSEEGKGSTFGFKLPIKSNLKMKQVSSPAPAAENHNPAAGELAAGVGVPVGTIEEAEKEGLGSETEKAKKDLETIVEVKS